MWSGLSQQRGKISSFNIVRPLGLSVVGTIGLSGPSAWPSFNSDATRAGAGVAVTAENLLKTVLEREGAVTGTPSMLTNGQHQSEGVCTCMCVCARARTCMHLCLCVPKREFSQHLY